MKSVVDAGGCIMFFSRIEIPHSKSAVLVGEDSFVSSILPLLLLVANQAVR